MHLPTHVLQHLMAINAAARLFGRVQTCVGLDGPKLISLRPPKGTPKEETLDFRNDDVTKLHTLLEGVGAMVEVSAIFRPGAEPVPRSILALLVAYQDPERPKLAEPLDINCEVLLPVLDYRLPHDCEEAPRSDDERDTDDEEDRPF